MADTLMDMLHFSQADLVENRRGVLSAAQQAHLAAQNAGCTRWMGILTALAAAGAAVLVVLRVVTGNDILLAGAIAAGVLAAVIGGMMLAFARQKTTYTLHTARGKAQLTAEQKHQPGQPVNKITHSYTLVVDGVKFNLSKAVFEQLQSNTNYAVYYVGEGYTHIVALEQA